MSTIHSQPQPTSAGNEVLSNVNFATKRLKDLWMTGGESETEQTFEDITRYLSVQHAEEKHLNVFKSALEGMAEIRYNPRGANGKGTYSYRPAIPARNAEQLKAYLQSRPEFRGVTLAELTDGWELSDCTNTLESMERKHEILVFRHNGKIINVFEDDPTLYTNISDDMKIAWKETVLASNQDDLRIALEKAGLKPTTAPRQLIQNVQRVEKKRKAPRTGGRQTNSHISHLLKDYSHMKK